MLCYASSNEFKQGMVFNRNSLICYPDSSFCFSLPAWRRALRWRGSAQRCLPENEGTNVYFSIAWHCIVFYNFNGFRGRNVFATVRTRGPSNIWNCLWSTWTTLHCNGGNMHNGVLRNPPCMTTTNIVDLALPVITRLILVSKVSIWEHVWISRSNHVIQLQLPWRRSTPECPNPSADGRCRWGACAQARCCSIPWPSSSHHLIFFGIELDHGSNKIDKDPKRKNCMFVEFHTKYPQQTENSPQKKIMQHVFKARTAVARPNSNSNAWRPGNLNCTAWVSKAWRKVWQVQSIQFTNSSQFTTVFSHVYESTKLIRMACWSKGRPVVPWWSIQTFRRPMLPPWWICKSCPGPNTLQAKFSEQMQKPCHLTKKWFIQHKPGNIQPVSTSSSSARYQNVGFSILSVRSPCNDAASLKWIWDVKITPA